MKITESRIVAELRPTTNNPRNSEGDFVRLRDGRILFAYSRFTGNRWNDDAPSDIAAIYLDSDGSSLLSESPEILVRAEEYGVSNIMSVSLMRMNNGDIGLFYLIKHESSGDKRPGWDNCAIDGVLRRSTDEHTFPKESEVLCTSNRFKAYYVVNNNRVLRTSSGRLIVPAARHRASYSPHGIDFDSTAAAQIFYSDDDGFTWREVIGDITLPSSARSRTGMQEPGVIELPGGAICLYARTDRMYQYESLSPDNGITWTPAQPSGFTSPDSPMKIARNPYSGLYYAVWNPIPNYNGRVNPPSTAGRTPLVLAESRDGIHFTEYALLEDDPNRGYCYPAIFFLGEKELLISYCNGLPEDGFCLCSTAIRRVTIE